MVIPSFDKLMIFLPLTSQISSATCEMRPAVYESQTKGQKVSFYASRRRGAESKGRKVGRTEVVRDDHDTPGEGLDGGRERVDGLHVQVIRRLIEQDNGGVLHG
jgi:hypothetical protein